MSIILLDARVRRELDALPVGLQASFKRMTEVVRQHGRHALREPLAKHLQGDLWELRFFGKEGSARAIYVVTEPETMTIVRVFKKTTQRTPVKELRIAMMRSKEIG